MNSFNPNINYANPGASKTEMETLQDTVNSMCSMWSEIAREMNAKQIGKPKEKKIEKRTVHKPIESQPTKYSLSAEEIRDIINANMEQEPGTDIDENEEEEMKESELLSSKPTLYDNMFEE